MKKSYKFISFIVSIILILNIKPVIPQSVYNRRISNVYNILSTTYKKKISAVRIMTYNILSDNIIYGGSPAQLREKEMIKLIDTITPDVLSLQEVSESWFDVFKEYEALKFVDFFYNFSKPMTLMLYNPETLKLLKSSSKAYNATHNPRLRRIDYAIFLQKSTNKKFITVNTHLSVYKEDSNESLKQAEELVSYCKDLETQYKYPIFISGDFNSFNRKSENDKKCTVYEYVSLYAQNTNEIANTITFGNNQNINTPSLDHIFIKGQSEILNFNILSFDELTHLSDHYPIFADVILKE